ncbi:Peptidoglycan/LPS O-acetylase OafA/YrhL, contains acyltransferase and SGNH-hydrolase domains [Aliiroseovarius halocynthiae]|uniref:Acyltransferase n=1 Tax=Aliiroseovarius halocynthiae TaxID=985055 RepID=A0A545SNU8_9RHOB|nr:acyltransferase family protein [Aliiroseovarius halocynthiae]TQV66631.1 acyltransferase [Aliiroseovarius halocynthiae]SMR82494.1 Peptidoglycan/LPS O-acetylase OafA/YrhL, contains acyltransferase and SGNH-hydrolase domains [Aliiroseovarius halocynthiae]
MVYRPEIDGLRAIAVLPVIFFHAGFGLFEGGFVGVDVFFVISGYLITSILIDDIELGRFSLLKFYERRARRILPALFFVVICTVPFAILWMLPAQLRDYSQSLVAVSLFSSNFLFWLESGYFEAGADLKPLLHTWSLAIEEQFYVVFPVLLLVLGKLGRRTVIWILTLIALISLGLAEWGWRGHPAANFFLAPARVWELLAGSLCSFALHRRLLSGNDVAATLGLIAIALAIFLFDSTTPFPSLYTLLPVVGVVLIILFGGQGTQVAALLSAKPLVAVGLISYSAYLWHQPLFAFARIRSLTEPSLALMLGLAALSLILAAFSWRFVEKPFRAGLQTRLTSQTGVFAASIFGLVLTAGIGVWGHLNKGFPDRFSPQALAVLKLNTDQIDRSCHFDEATSLLVPKPGCLFTTPGANSTVMLLGDSHVAAIAGATVSALKASGRNVYVGSYGGCIPLPTTRRVHKPTTHKCAEFVDAMLAYAGESGIDTLILAGRFPAYLQGTRFDNGEGGVEHGIRMDIRDLNTDPDNPWRRNVDMIRVKIEALSAQFNLVLLAPIPEAGWNVPELIAKRMYYHGGEEQTLTTPYSAYVERTKVLMAEFSMLAAWSDNITVAPIHRRFCDSEIARCLHADGDQIFYLDDDHLSPAGAELIAPDIVEAVGSLPTR